MRLFKKKVAPEISRTQALQYKPVKSGDITEMRLESGEVLIEYPMTLRPLAAAVAKRLGVTPTTRQTKKLQLDVLGTTVWDLLDGRRSVSQIIEIFAQTHRLENREAEVSVTRFIRELGRRGLLGLQ